MAEEEKKVEEKEETVEPTIIKEVEKTEEELIKKFGEREKVEDEIARWIPKTKVGKLVKEKKMTNLDEILDKYKILEPEIVDCLITTQSDLLSIGQSKGKFGGGKRRAWRQTQKKTKEGNVPTFTCMAVVGDEKGHIGVGIGKAKETLPARTKALRDAKLKIMKIRRGCGSFDCSCGEEHSIPVKVEGKCGSTTIVLMPAPQGTGLVVGDQCKKVLRLAGIKDVYARSFGQTRTTINLINACIIALRKTTQIKENKK